jgi:hypothetical protein
VLTLGIGLVGFLIMVVVLGGGAFIVLRSLLGAQGSAPLAGTWGKILAVVFLLTVFLYLFSFIVPRRK